MNQTDSISLHDKLSKSKPAKEQAVPKFLKKTFDMLEEDKWHSIVSWSDDGLAMLIKKPTDFSETVLPTFFKHNNIASFVRQLNMYNFKKRKAYNYDHSYGHEMFVRGRSDLLINIKRKANDNTITVNKSELKKEENNDDSTETLSHENMLLKRVHKDLNNRVKYIEDKIKDLNTENQALSDQYQKQTFSQDYLKKVIYTLSQINGQQNIQKIIEAVVYSKSLKNMSMTNPEYLNSLVSRFLDPQYIQAPQNNKDAAGQYCPPSTANMCNGNAHQNTNGEGCSWGRNRNGLCLPCLEPRDPLPNSGWSLEGEYLANVARVSGVDNSMSRLMTNPKDSINGMNSSTSSEQQFLRTNSDLSNSSRSTYLTSDMISSDQQDSFMIGNPVYDNEVQDQNHQNRVEQDADDFTDRLFFGMEF